jgi:MFS family permease
VTHLLQPHTSAPTRTRRIGGRPALYLEASVILAFLAASSAPTPLYAVYQDRWHFNAATVTIVFGIYAVAVLAALLTVGSLSDHLGRRPVLLAALAVEAAGLVVFVVAAGLLDLVIGRILQGAATGAAAGTVGAGMVDIDRTLGTLANAVAPVTGTATGALVSGLFVQYLPDPTRLVYLVLLGILAAQTLGVALLAETATRRPGALASLRPRFQLPRPVRRPLLVAVPALVAAWALAGFYGSLGPALIATLSHSTSVFLGGLGLFVLAGSGAAFVLAVRRVAPPTVARAGTAALCAGVAITLAATAAGSTIAFFAGTAIAGAGFAGGFQGAIRTVLPLTTDENRAGVLSIVYLISYLAMGVPAVIGGLVAVHTHALDDTARGYGAVVIALAAAALLGLTRRHAAAPALTAEDGPCPQPCMG